MVPLNLSSYQQSALAELCSAISTIKYKWEVQQEILSMEDFDKVLNVVDGYHNVNWGELYDKLHRTGSNS